MRIQPDSYVYGRTDILVEKVQLFSLQEPLVGSRVMVKGYL